jgi:hypothetical protein
MAHWLGTIMNWHVQQPVQNEVEPVFFFFTLYPEHEPVRIQLYVAEQHGNAKM